LIEHMFDFVDKYRWQRLVSSAVEESSAETAWESHAVGAASGALGIRRWNPAVVAADWWNPAVVAAGWRNAAVAADWWNPAVVARGQTPPTAVVTVSTNSWPSSAAGTTEYGDRLSTRRPLKHKRNRPIGLLLLLVAPETSRNNSVSGRRDSNPRHPPWQGGALAS
jgi:hypothetical protein